MGHLRLRMQGKSTNPGSLSAQNENVRFVQSRMAEGPNLHEE